MTWEIRQGDALERLREMPAGSVQTCVTSPPYFGLRDYGTGEWEGGEEGCDHKAGNARNDAHLVFPTAGPDRRGSFSGGETYFKETCGKCGARRVDNQVGLEATPDAYVARLVEVFREVRRVLRDDGTLWLNLGDSYAANAATAQGREGFESHRGSATPTLNRGHQGRTAVRGNGIKPKDLLGIPWLVAFALRADGWYLRSDIVWAKKNCMPESVRDRPTRSHEYIFLLTKNPRYYFDQDAVREGMPALLDDAPDHGLLRAEESPEPRLNLQGVRQGEGEGLASAGRSSQRPRGGTTLCADPSWAREAGGVPTVSGAEAADQGVSPDAGGEGGSAAGQQVGGREGSAEAVLGDGQGPGGNSTQAREASSSLSGGGGDPDDSGVGGDFGDGSGPLHVLSRGQAADDGSCHPAESGRGAHEGQRGAGVPSVQQPQEGSSTGRNIRSVWHIATAPYAGAHFAVFPPKLIEPCVLAGSSPKACGVCGAPWERLTEGGESTYEARKAVGAGGAANVKPGEFGGMSAMHVSGHSHDVTPAPRRTVGWEPSCDCADYGTQMVPESRPSVVLDPFSGAGTTGLVALQHGRSFIGIELNPAYVEMASERIASAERLGFRAPERGPEPMAGQTSIFGDEAA